jgi:RNA polymerase sigma-70 factor (ECF subfamily)
MTSRIAMTAPTDSAQTRRLLSEIVAGRPDAFDRLFDRHRERLLGVVKQRISPSLQARVDPSDVVQDAYIEASRRLQDYLNRRPMPFHLWLRKTVQQRLTKITEHHAAARRSNEREEPLPNRSSLLLARRLVGVVPSASREASRRERASRVREALQRLSDEEREILLLRYLEQFSDQEIGFLLEIDSTTAGRRIGRALLRLGRILHRMGIGEVEP